MKTGKKPNRTVATLLCWISQVLKPRSHVGTFLQFFLIYGSSDVKLKFIIDGAKIPCQMFDMQAQPVLDIVVEPCKTTYYLLNPEPGGNEPNQKVTFET